MSTADKVLQALRAYDLKQESKNKYRSNSPLRPDSNSHAFTLTINDDEHGAYHDFVSGESGSLYDLAKHLNIDLPQKDDKAPIVTTKRAYTGIADYAAAHGLTADDLARWRWREVLKQNRLALEFETRTGKRWRYLDGKKPYYTSEPGYERCWYGLNQDVMKRLNAGHPLVICNGEISTIAGQKAGLAAICVTGGENAIPPELIADMWAIDKTRNEILVALDCDRKGIAAAHQIVNQFKSHGYKVRAVDLGLGHGGDLADFCMLNAEIALPALLLRPTLVTEDAETIQNRTWTIIHASELKNLPTVSWLVRGEIPEKGLTVIYGPSGVGKSFLSLDYALTVAQSRTVVYVAAEGESGYSIRVSAWCQHNDKREGKLYLCLGSPNMMDDADLESFIAVIASMSPAMVIVDTLAMAMIGGDENSARDMGKVILASRVIQREADCAVVLVHHTNKGGTVERGSGALRGAADSMIRVTGDDDIILVESTKSKDSAPFDTRYMKLLPVKLADGNESRVLVHAAKVLQQITDPLTRNQRRILELLNLPVFKTDGASLSELMDESTESNLSRGSVLRIISRLMELGFVRQEAKRAPYFITEAGTIKLKDSEDSEDSVDSQVSPRSFSDSEFPPSQPSQPSLVGLVVPATNSVNYYSERL
jgi:hypothetical protein